MSMNARGALENNFERKRSCCRQTYKHLYLYYISTLIMNINKLDEERHRIQICIYT